MPLSEHEQRLLEQMERALNADDPKLASTLSGSRSGPHDRRRLLGGALAVLAGAGLLIAGVASQVWALGVVGFLVMLAGVWVASTGWGSGARGKSAERTGKASAGRPSRGGFMRRIEDRWDRRRDERDR